jgi:hypothetical protein
VVQQNKEHGLRGTDAWVQIPGSAAWYFWGLGQKCPFSLLVHPCLQDEASIYHTQASQQYSLMGCKWLRESQSTHCKLGPVMDVGLARSVRQQQKGRQDSVWRMYASELRQQEAHQLRYLLNRLGDHLPFLSTCKWASKKPFLWYFKQIPLPLHTTKRGFALRVQL